MKRFSVLVLVLLVSFSYGQLIHTFDHYCIDNDSVSINLKLEFRAQVEQQIAEELQRLDLLYKGYNDCSSKQSEFGGHRNKYGIAFVLTPITYGGNITGTAIAIKSEVFSILAYSDPNILAVTLYSTLDVQVVSETTNDLNALVEKLKELTREEFEYMLIELRENIAEDETSTNTQVLDTRILIPNKVLINICGELPKLKSSISSLTSITKQTETSFVVDSTNMIRESIEEILVAAGDIAISELGNLVKGFNKLRGAVEGVSGKTINTSLRELNAVITNLQNASKLFTENLNCTN